MTVSKRLRYEVLRRDGHTCRYCGRTAPEVALSVDHVKPTALGGRDEPENLVTACVDCNQGKASVPAGAPVVSDVAADALRWKQALEEAAFARSVDRQMLDEQIAEVGRSWDAWHSTRTGEVNPRPQAWLDTVERFLSLGLGVEEMDRLIGVTMRKGFIAREELWTYFCGCCWRTIDDLQADVKELIEGGGRVDGPD